LLGNPGKMAEFNVSSQRICVLTSGVPRGRLGGSNPPKFRRFDEVEPDCKLNAKCLVFLFQHPNWFKSCCI